MWWLQGDHEQLQGKTGMREGVTEEGSVSPSPTPPLKALSPEVHHFYIKR